MMRRAEADADLRAVVNSTLAIIFFGTPHRGSDLADTALKVAQVASAVTLKPHNRRIIQMLPRDTEILRKLRKDFESTLGHMIQHNRFESSPFQEAKRMNGIAGLHGKVQIHSYFPGTWY